MPTTSEELKTAKENIKLKQKLSLEYFSNNLPEEDLRAVKCIDASWAGGKEGNEITEKILSIAEV